MFSAARAVGSEICSALSQRQQRNAAETSAEGSAEVSAIFLEKLIEVRVNP
jgi:hypothetical protein